MWTRLPSSSLRVTGADRVDFVHGQMTNDLRSAPTPGLVSCAFLNVRGQLEQFARAYRRQDDLYLHLDEGQAAPLLARLKRYIIFDQVEVQDVTPELGTVHVWREQDCPGWQLDGPAAQQFNLADQLVLGGRVNRSGQPGVDLHFLTRRAADLLPLLPSPELALADLHAARVQAGIPDVVADAFQGFLPQEIGLDITGPVPAISYRKGCYVGQEIMARLEARGNTRYHLVRLQGQSELTSHAEVTQDGRVVGQTGRAAGTLALARLRKELPDGASVLVGDVNAVVQLLAPAHA